MRRQGSWLVQLTPRRASALLGVDEATLRRWIDDRGLPVHYADERPYIHPVELWEWAAEQGIAVPAALLDVARHQAEEMPALSVLLQAGGIHLVDVRGADKAQVLAEVASRLPLPAGVDRQALTSMLEAREAMGSTGIGDGIAIPHVRNPIVLHVERPLVALFLLREPIEFDAVDGEPVKTLFVVVSPTIPLHLRLLARLGQVLQDPELRTLLRSGGASADAVLGRIRTLEALHAGTSR
jgi:PTS system nitrogen regulatory IIA component